MRTAICTLMTNGKRHENIINTKGNRLSFHFKYFNTILNYFLTLTLIFL